MGRARPGMSLVHCWPAFFLLTPAPTTTYTSMGEKGKKKGREGKRK